MVTASKTKPDAAQRKVGGGATVRGIGPEVAIPPTASTARSINGSARVESTPLRKNAHWWLAEDRGLPAGDRHRILARPVRDSGDNTLRTASEPVERASNS